MKNKKKNNVWSPAFLIQITFCRRFIFTKFFGNKKFVPESWQINFFNCVHYTVHKHLEHPITSCRRGRSQESIWKLWKFQKKRVSGKISWNLLRNSSFKEHPPPCITKRNGFLRSFKIHLRPFRRYVICERPLTRIGLLSSCYFKKLRKNCQYNFPNFFRPPYVFRIRL